jgi:hypothetical protein
MHFLIICLFVVCFSLFFIRLQNKICCKYTCTKPAFDVRNYSFVHMRIRDLTTLLIANMVVNTCANYREITCYRLTQSADQCQWYPDSSCKHWYVNVCLSYYCQSAGCNQMLRKTRSNSNRKCVCVYTRNTELHVCSRRHICYTDVRYLVLLTRKSANGPCDWWYPLSSIFFGTVMYSVTIRW